MNVGLLVVSPKGLASGEVVVTATQKYKDVAYLARAHRWQH